MTTTIPVHGSTVPRQEVDSAYQWQITDIFPNDEAWADMCADVKDAITAIKSMQGGLINKNSILVTLHIRDEIAKALELIYPYARLQQDVDNGNGHNQFLTGTAEVIISDFDNATSFIEPELLALPQEELEALANDPDCPQYAFYFQELLRNSQHVLSANEEAIVAASSLATSGAENIFRTLVGADLTFPAALDSANQEHSVSEGSYLLNMTNEDRTLRQNTFVNLMSTYHNLRNTLAATLTAKARSSHYYATVHKYPDTIHKSLDSDNIPVELYDNLIDVVHEYLPVLHDYISLKKQALQVDSFEPYDMYMPLVKLDDNCFSFTYQEACSTVQTALAPLGEEYGAALQHGLTNGWVDVYENQGKRSGAYSWGVYGKHPYVLLNFQPRYNSVSTLAHEMGHALHSYFSNQHQPFPTADYTIFCAEVASTTNEILLLEHMLQKATPQQKLYLLNQYLEAIRTTVFRQVQFAEFEKAIHGEINKGTTLTADYLEELWNDLNKKYYGDELSDNKLLNSEWSRIPHFYTPFYVYKYATGYCSATAFATAILEQQPQAVEKYLHFLQSGGSDYSLSLLKNAGVDLTTPAPIATTLEKFKTLLAELKSLI